MSYADVATTPMHAIRAYLAHLPARMAEMRLMLAGVIILPHTDKAARRKLVDGWTKTLQQNAPALKRVAHPAVLGMLGIGVQFVAPEESNGNQSG